MQILIRHPNFLYLQPRHTHAFAPVADIGTQGDFALAPGLTRAIELAERDLALHLDNITKAPPPKRPRHTPPTLP